MKELIRREILDASATPVPRFTGRTVRLPGVPGKAVTATGSPPTPGAIRLHRAADWLLEA